MAQPIKTESNRPAAKVPSKPDIASLAGLVIAFGGILGGLLIEGGKLKDVSQFTAALIVLGGTSGAVMVSTPIRTLIGGLKRLKGVFFDAQVEIASMIEEDRLRHQGAQERSGIARIGSLCDRRSVSEESLDAGCRW